MQKLLAAFVVATFALGSVQAFAADAAKREDLTQDQRADMRTRADQLARARASGTEKTNVNEQPAPVVKKMQHKSKARKVSRHTVKKAQPKS